MTNATLYPSQCRIIHHIYHLCVECTMRLSDMLLTCWMPLQMLVDLGQDVYQEELEQAFLREASAFYKVSPPFPPPPGVVAPEQYICQSLK